VATQGIQCWLQDLSSDLRLEEVLDRIVENALQACPGREFALLITVEDKLTLVRSSGIGPAAGRRLEAWVRSFDATLAEPHEIAELAHYPELATLTRRPRLGALRALPLLSNGRSLGVLVALTPAAEPFDDDDRELLTAFGEQAALALANAHLFQTLLERATSDPLTGLPNRREFDRLLARELQRSSRYGQIFSVTIIDLDHFKQLNDTRGHAAGDAVLRQTAATIEDVCRASDVAARIGGDEFALLLPETNQFEAAALCERLRSAVEKVGEVSLSWGVAEYPRHGVTASKLTRAADAAMYASKPNLAGAATSREAG